MVDLSRALAGPHAGMMLADLGARVIKVENPGTGDDTRGWGPPFVGPEDDPQATYFLSCNRNKESIALDLKSDDGRTVLRELLERADVVIENFRPGVLDRLGFSAAEMHALNPALVVLSITGFGHDGPESRRSGYDQILQGEAGLMSLTGSGPDDPQRVGVPIADLLSGMYGAFGTLAALLQRERTGQGQIVRTSLLAALIGVHAFQGTRATVAGEVAQGAGQPPPVHRALRAVPLPAGPRADQRGQREAVDARSPRRSESTRTVPSSPSNAERVRNREKVIEEVERAFADYEAEPLLAKLNEAGIPAGKVRTLDEVYAWEQVHSQGLVIDVDHKILGNVSLPGPAAALLQRRRHRRNHAQGPHRAAAAGPGRRADPAVARAWSRPTRPRRRRTGEGR